MEYSIILTPEQEAIFQKVALSEGNTVESMIHSMIVFYVYRKYEAIVSADIYSKLNEYTPEEKGVALSVMPEPASKALKG